MSHYPFIILLIFFVSTHNLLSVVSTHPTESESYIYPYCIPLLIYILIVILIYDMF